MKLYNIILLSVIGIVTVTSCGEHVPKEFVQPSVLKKGSAFNVSKLNFQEDVLQLISQSLDPGDKEFTGKNYEVFKLKDIFKEGELPESTFVLGEDRYYFQTKELDSIAQFDSLYFDRVNLETDKDKHLLSLIGHAKFRRKEDLDKQLSKLFKKLGKTTEELEIAAGDQKLVEDLKADGLSDKEIEFIGGNRGTSYNLLDYGDDSYFEWKLKDRYIQIGISKDREISISTTPEDNFNIEYLYVEFLVIKKEEYEKVAKMEYERAVRLQRESHVLKPYTLYAISPLYNQDFAAKLREAWEKN